MTRWGIIKIKCRGKFYEEKVAVATQFYADREKIIPECVTIWGITKKKSRKKNTCGNGTVKSPEVILIKYVMLIRGAHVCNLINNIAEYCLGITLYFHVRIQQL